MRRRHAVFVLLSLFAIAIALRPQIVAIGPLLPEIQGDLGISHAVAGLLGTIPVLCMGLFAPPAPYLLGHVGTRTAIFASITLIGAAGVVRALMPGAAGVILMTIPVGIGIGLAGALMPVAVKERFPHRPTLATGVYATGINAGSTIAAAVAVPIAAAAGGWRSALLAFSVATLVLPLLWLWQTRQEPAHERTGVRPLRLPVGSVVAWILVALFALLAICYYGVIAWLPDSYIERGWSDESAGALLAALNGASGLGGLAIGVIADRHGSRRFYLVTLATFQAIALIGVILVPEGGWAWVALFGVAQGALFALVMTLPLDVSRDAAGVASAAALMLGAGYTIGALSPFVLGALRDSTGSFTQSLWLLAGAASLFVLLGATLTSERLRRGVHAAPAPVSAGSPEVLDGRPDGVFERGHADPADGGREPADSELRRKR
jgi:MFS transporter, CP family, cyanate transporter